MTIRLIVEKNIIAIFFLKEDVDDALQENAIRLVLCLLIVFLRRQEAAERQLTIYALRRAQAASECRGNEPPHIADIKALICFFGQDSLIEKGSCLTLNGRNVRHLRKIKMLHECMHGRAAIHRTQGSTLCRTQKTRYFPFLPTCPRANSRRKGRQNLLIGEVLTLEFRYAGLCVDLFRSPAVIRPTENSVDIRCTRARRKRLSTANGRKFGICHTFRLTA